MVKKSFGSVNMVLEENGFKFWEEVCPSARAFNANREGLLGKGIKEELVREEWSMSTIAVIVWLATWSRQRHKLVEQQQAAALLETFFGQFLDPADYFYDKLVSQYDREMNDCIVRNSQQTPCRHLRYEMRHISNSYKNWHWAEFVELLTTLVIERDCDACAPIGRRLVMDVGLHIDGNLLKEAAADSLKDSWVYKTPAGKRRRVDEDFKLALSGLGTPDGDKMNDVARFTDMCSARTAYGASFSMVKARRLAAQRELTCQGVVIVADDSSGHGKPAESTLISLVHDGVANFTAHGQPQVLSMRPYEHPH